MTGQMQRLAYLQAAQSLEAAADDSLDALLELSVVYNLVKRHEGDKGEVIDPATIAAGIQAQALGCRLLSKWLVEISRSTSPRYESLGQSLFFRVQSEMEALGLVIPDVMVQ